MLSLSRGDDIKIRWKNIQQGQYRRDFRFIARHFDQALVDQSIEYRNRVRGNGQTIKISAADRYCARKETLLSAECEDETNPWEELNLCSIFLQVQINLDQLISLAY